MKDYAKSYHEIMVFMKKVNYIIWDKYTSEEASHHTPKKTEELNDYDA